MEEDKGKNFAFALAITLGTIVLGLISYIFFTSNTLIKKEPPRCEYYGWAYADKEIFDSQDGCNTCFCHTGEIVCTQEVCNQGENTEELNLSE
ncbi:hypothetical protein KBB42_02535 [Candidatus Dojkabacteria bacterium]|nr:hypothetical protein [Candidatus Dojkabacteria bacterium]